jgi:hypothetical protein
MKPAMRQRIGWVSLAIMLHVVGLMPLMHPLFHKLRGHSLAGHGAVARKANAGRPELAAASKHHACPICRFLAKYKAPPPHRAVLSCRPLVGRPTVRGTSRLLSADPAGLSPCRSPPLPCLSNTEL